VGETDPQWTCDKLDVATLLDEGEKLTYYIGRALGWLLSE
jgi:hypothetical protein